MIFDMTLEVVGQLIDPTGQKRDLHVRTAGVFLMHAQRVDVLSFCHTLKEGWEYAPRSEVGK